MMINESEYCIIENNHNETLDYENIYYTLNNFYVIMIILSLMYFYTSIIYEFVCCNGNNEEIIKISQTHAEYSNNHFIMKKMIENINNKICKLEIKIEKLNKKQKKNYKKISENINENINKLMLLQDDNC